jgi:hypothetical protein
VRLERLFLDRNASDEKKFSRRKKNYTHRKKTTLWQRMSSSWQRVSSSHAMNADTRSQHEHAKHVTGMALRDASAVTWKRWNRRIGGRSAQYAITIDCCRLIVVGALSAFVRRIVEVRKFVVF